MRMWTKTFVLYCNTKYDRTFWVGMVVFHVGILFHLSMVVYEAICLDLLSLIIWSVMFVPIIGIFAFNCWMHRKLYVAWKNKYLHDVLGG